MMKTRTCLIPVMVSTIGIGVGGCDDRETAPRFQQPNIIIPLAVGNRWSGPLITLNSDGETLSTCTLTVSMEASRLVGDEEWFDIVVSDRPSLDPMGWLQALASRPDGIWAGYDTLFHPFFMSVWAKHPAEVGDSYRAGAYSWADVTVASTDTVITAPLGSYNCHLYNWYRYNLQSDHPEQQFYLAPEVGFVRWDIYRGTDGNNPYLEQQWTLDSLILK